VPPRFAYWTILIDNTATAFRAQHAEDLLPTLVQLRRTNKDVVMKWFARGRLWESPESARAAAQKPKVREKRGRDWRPGGQHEDPRARFDKRRSDKRTGQDVTQAFRPARKPKAFVPRHGKGPDRFQQSKSKGSSAGGWRPARSQPRHDQRSGSKVGDVAARSTKPQHDQRSGSTPGEAGPPAKPRSHRNRKA